MLHIIGAEFRQRESGYGCVGHLGLQLGQARAVVRRDGAARQLMGQRRDVRLVDQAGFGQETVCDGRGSEGGEHRPDVDGHIEQAERRIALGRIFRVVIQIADHDLQVSLEQAGSQGYQQQGADHQRDAETVGGCWNRQQQVAQEHHADPRDDAAPIADPVGQPAAYHGQEIYDSQEDGIELAGRRLLPAKLGLEEKHEDGQHRIVAETLARIGQRQRIKTFRLTFEHKAMSLSVDINDLRVGIFFQVVDGVAFTQVDVAEFGTGLRTDPVMFRTVRGCQVKFFQIG